MKKKYYEAGIGIIMVLFLVAVMTLMSSTEAYAATTSKKSTKKTTKTEVTMTESEKTLEALKLYRDKLVSGGAVKEDIDKAEAAVAMQMAIVNTEKENVKAAQAKAEAMVKNLGTVFVGDSRMVQMHETMGETGVIYIAENAKGYDWFSEQALQQVDALAVKGSKIVINLGVNDTQNIDKYISLINTWAPVWTQRGAKVYYATVNPVSENPYTSSEQVSWFNSQLVNGLKGINIIDTNYYLKQSGYRLVDGLHYDGPTYVNLYNYLIEVINGK